MKDDTERKRFELAMGGDTVFANYRLDGPALYINHVEAPEALRGTGAAGRLMQGIADHARAKGLKIVPVCGYAASWLRRHPETHDLLNT